MSGDRHRVSDNHFITDNAIVRDMRIGHEKTFSADRGHAARGGSTVQCHAFTNFTARANDQARAFAGVFQILRRSADKGAGKNLAAGADFGKFNDRMRAHAHVVMQNHIFAQHGIRANLDALAQLRGGMDDGGGVNQNYAALGAG